MIQLRSDSLGGISGGCGRVGGVSDSSLRLRLRMPPPFKTKGARSNECTTLLIPMEFVDFASRGSESAVYVAGLPKARAADIVEQIQTQTAGPALTCNFYQNHARTSSCILVLTTQYAAARAIEAWDGVTCFGRKISVKPAKRSGTAGLNSEAADTLAAGWRGIHKIPLLTAHQCTLVCNACLGVTAWSSSVASVTAVTAEQVSPAAFRLNLSQQNSNQHDQNDHIEFRGLPQLHPAVQGSEPVCAAAQPRAANWQPVAQEASQASQQPAGADDADTGPPDLACLQSVSGSFFATPLHRASTGCVEQALPSAPEQNTGSMNQPQCVFRDALCSVSGVQASAEAGLDFSECTWSEDPPLNTSAASTAAESGGDVASEADSDGDEMLPGDILGSLQAVDDSGFVPDLHSGLLLPGTPVPHKPEQLQEHDIGWAAGVDVCISDGGAVFDNGPLDALIEGGEGGGSAPRGCDADVPADTAHASSETAAYLSEVHVWFAGSGVVVAGRAAYGQDSDEAAAARAAETAARRVASSNSVHASRHALLQAQAAAREGVLLQFAQRWAAENEGRRLARWRNRATEHALQAAFRQVRLLVQDGGPAHGGRAHVLVQGPESGTTGLEDAAGGSTGGLPMCSPQQAQTVVAQCQ